MRSANCSENLADITCWDRARVGGRALNFFRVVSTSTRHNSDIQLT